MSSQGFGGLDGSDGSEKWCFFGTCTLASLHAPVGKSAARFLVRVKFLRCQLRLAQDFVRILPKKALLV